MKTAAAKVEELAPINLAAIAQECIDGTENASLAAIRFRDRALADPELLDAIIERRLLALCATIIGQQASRDRAALGEQSDRAPRMITAGEFAGAVALSLLDYRVEGRRIGDLKRGDLTVMSMGLATQAQDAQIKSRWLGLIAAALPNEDKKVDDVLTSEKLAELRTKAREQV